LFPDAIQADLKSVLRGPEVTMALVKEACAAAAGLSTAPAMLQPIREFVENEPIAKAGGSRKSFVYDLSERVWAQRGRHPGAFCRGVLGVLCTINSFMYKAGISVL